MAIVAHPPLIDRVRRAHWLMLDYAVAGGYALLLVPMLGKYADGPAGLLIVLTGMVSFTVPIALRRRSAALAMILLVAGSILALLGQPRMYLAAILPMTFVLYHVAAGPRRLAFAGLGASLATAAAAALPSFTHLGATVASGLGYLTVWTAGYAVGMHRRYTDQLLQQQARLADADLAQARRDIIQERLRIARDLHDVIAHSMSVVTVQAAFGALVSETDPLQARSALESIEHTGREALSELRALLGVLRAADSRGEPERAALEPSPSLADLDQLAARIGTAGVQVQLVVTATRPMPAGVELVAFRIVQEALTNVVRHANTARARVLIEQRDDQLHIDVFDDGSSAAAGPPGHGLIGMRERVLAYGGVLEAAPSVAGGFRVHAAIPLDAHATPVCSSPAA